MLAIAGALLLGGTIFYLVYSTQMAAEASAAKDRIGIDWGNSDKPFQAPFYIKFTRPLLKDAYLDLAVGFWKPADLEHWKRALRAAGLSKHIQPEHFVASRFYLGTILSAFLILHYLFASEPGPIWLPFLIGAGAFFIPILHLQQLRDGRQHEVRLALPYVIDLMTLSMEAGLEFMGAVSRVVERAPKGPLIDELAEMLKDIQLGKSRAEALRKMADAIDITEITSLVAILISADQMGSPVSPVLRAQSDTMRLERLVKAEKLGAQASQKILLPLVFFIMPAVFLMIFGPIILQMLGVQ